MQSLDHYTIKLPAFPFAPALLSFFQVPPCRPAADLSLRCKFRLRFPTHPANRYGHERHRLSISWLCSLVSSPVPAFPGRMRQSGIIRVPPGGPWHGLEGVQVRQDSAGRFCRRGDVLQGRGDRSPTLPRRLAGFAAPRNEGIRRRSTISAFSISTGTGCGRI